MASKAIKGITIKLDGDANELSTAITSADRAIANLEKDLKSVNKALKLDPTNTEQLARKQALLTREIEETKKKLEAEQEAAERAAEALEQGAITQDEYDALQAEISETTTKLKQLEEQAKSFGSVTGQQLKAVGDKVQEVGQSVTEFGQTLTTHVTAPIVALAGASIAAFNEVDDGLDLVAARTGATGEELERFKEIAISIAEEIPTDFNTAGAAVGQVQTRFRLTGTELQNLSKKFIQFAALNNIDVTSAINTVQRAMASFDVDTEDAAAVLDMLNAVGQETGVTMDTLGSLLASNSEVFRQLGFNMAEAAQFLGEVELSGVDTSAIMTGLRKALAQAAEEGIPLNEFLADFQTQLEGATDGSEAMNMAIDLFGTKAAPQFIAMLRDGQVSLQGMGTDLEDFAGNLETTYNNTIDAGDEFTVALNSAKAAGAELGGDILESLVPALETLTELLQSARDWWASLDESEKNTIITIAGVVAAIGPLIMGIGTVITSIGSFISMLGSLSVIAGGAGITSLSALGTVITGTVIPALAAVAIPALAVIAVIAAIIAVVLAVKKVMETADAWVWAFGQLWTGLKGIIENVKTAIMNAAVTIGTSVAGIWNNIVSTLSGLKDQALAWGRDLIDNFVSGITSRISSVTDAVSGIASTVASYIHFSEPDVGPLSNFHTFAPDMMDLFAEGIEQNRGIVRSAMEGTAGDVADAFDYSGQLDSINRNLTESRNGPSPVFNVIAQFGNKTVGRAVAEAQIANDYQGGGRR